MPIFPSCGNTSISFKVEISSPDNWNGHDGTTTLLPLSTLLSL